MHGYLFYGKNPPYMPLLSPYTIILFYQKKLKNEFFAQNRHKNTDFFVTLHGYLSLHDYLILQIIQPYMLIQDSTSIRILRVITVH